MFNRTLFATTAAVLGLGVATPFVAQAPVQADTCTPLKPVGGQGFEVRKRIDGRPGGLVVSNNWNTDFIVPGGIRFKYYAVTITAENTANYDISIHFRYPNNTSDTVFQNGSVGLTRWQPWRLELQSPTGRQPFQVNTRIGGTNGNVYRVRVSGCR